jgi:hypothetical protein
MLIFFMLVPVLALCAALVLYLYMNSLGLTTGGGIHFLSIDYFLYSLTIVFPYCTVTVLLYLFLFLVRRPSNIPLSILFWVILAVFTWIVCFPVSFELKSRFHSIPHKTVEGYPSGEYFRKSENTLYYWFPEEGIPETIIEITPGTRGSAGNMLFRQNADAEGLAVFEGTDNIIREYVRPPVFLEKMLNAARGLMNRFEDAWYTGWKPYLIAISFGLTIAALWPFGWLTRWRLLNITLLCTCFLIVSLMNYKLNSSVILLRIAEAFTRRNSSISPFFPVIFNGFIFLFMNLVGGLTAFLRVLKRKNSEGKKR